MLTLLQNRYSDAEIRVGCSSESYDGKEGIECENEGTYEERTTTYQQ
jgi:hypothetical protein